MRKLYCIPEMEVILFGQRNVITESNKGPWVDDDTEVDGEKEGW